MSMKPGIEETSIDHTIRVQDDLFRHVNGKWFAETEIPEDKSMYGSFHMLADDAEAAVKEILLAATETKGAPQGSPAQQIGDLYASFMDEARANELGAAPIAAELNLIEHLTTLDEATKLIGEFSKHGIGGLFGSYVDNDPGNPSRYIVNLFHDGMACQMRPTTAKKSTPKFAMPTCRISLRCCTLPVGQTPMQMQPHTASWNLKPRSPQCTGITLTRAMQKKLIT